MNKILINAMNIHQGGGGVLLRALLAELPENEVVLFHDERFVLPKMLDNLKAIPVSPNPLARLKTEKQIANMALKGDQLFCFGNQPPLFKASATVTLYLHNALLVNDFSLREYPLRARVRNTLAKWLLKRFCKHVDRIWVQTPTMAAWAKKKMPSKKIEIKLFMPTITASQDRQSVQYDFSYIAHLEPHKNHRTLIEGWVALAKQGIRPSLCLTLASNSPDPLMKWIHDQVREHALKLTFYESTSHESILNLYLKSHALIYPSLCESLGMPLLEANLVGLPIIASDLPYIHDVVTPMLTFDPTSADSIARTVKKFLETDKSVQTPGVNAEKAQPMPVNTFWEYLLQA